MADRLCRSRTGGVEIAVRRANAEIAEEDFIEFEIIVLAGMDQAVVTEPVELLDRQRQADQLGPSANDRHHRSEEHTSELQSLMRISYAVFCLKQQKTKRNNNTPN